MRPAIGHISDIPQFPPRIPSYDGDNPGNSGFDDSMNWCGELGGFEQWPPARLIWRWRGSCLASNRHKHMMPFSSTKNIGICRLLGTVKGDIFRTDYYDMAAR